MTTLKKLFPVPAFLSGKLIPKPLAGISPESTATLQSTLIENHEKWHCFFNDIGFHNHTSHHLIAKYWLGATPEIIQAAYDVDKKIQRSAFKSPEEITEANVYDHVGDEKYYDSYKNFFTLSVLEKGVAATLDKYVFSKQSNYGSNGKNPEALSRFMGGLLHPMIHTGYGVESGLPGMVVEGLSQTYVHSVGDSSLVPQSLFDDISSGNKLADIAKSILSVSEDSSKVGAGPTSVFSILSRLIEDPTFDSIKQTNPDGMFRQIIKAHGPKIYSHARSWSLDLGKEGEIEKKVEELSWLVVLIYAVAGWTARREFDADFFQMHFVTSSIFLPSLLDTLPSTESKELLLRSYLTYVLAWYISRGRPVPDINAFYKTIEPSGTAPTLKDLEHAEPHKGDLEIPQKIRDTPNPWLPILSTTLTNSDDHLCKLQRALAHYSSLFGSRSSVDIPGLNLHDVQLKGKEKLDGKLFLRAASLTDDARERRQVPGEDASIWGRDGYYAK